MHLSHWDTKIVATVRLNQGAKKSHFTALGSFTPTRRDNFVPENGPANLDEKKTSSMTRQMTLPVAYMVKSYSS